MARLLSEEPVVVTRLAIAHPRLNRRSTQVLISVLVDAPKLSTTAEWPKWQHDAQNSGNPDFPRNAGCQ